MPEITLFNSLLLVIGGVFAGFINTLSGSGSAITLPLLMQLMGLDPIVANGTNRIGILLQSGTSSATILKSKKVALKTFHYYYLLIAVLGAILGAYIAITISSEQFKAVFKYLLLFMLVMILVNPKKLISEIEQTESFKPLLLIGFFSLGIYGGFIQMGMGVLYIMFSIVIGNLTLTISNTLKLLTTFIYTLIILFVFWSQNAINFKIGIILGIGQIIGAYLGTRVFLYNNNIKKWTYWALIISITITLIKVFLF